EAFDHLWICQSQFLSNHSTHRVAEHVDGSAAQSHEDGCNIVRHITYRILFDRTLVALTGVPVIHSHTHETCVDKGGNLRLGPSQLICSQPREQDNRLATTRCFVVHTKTVYFDIRHQISTYLSIRGYRVVFRLKLILTAFHRPLDPLEKQLPLLFLRKMGNNFQITETFGFPL